MSPPAGLLRRSGAMLYDSLLLAAVLMLATGIAGLAGQVVVAKAYGLAGLRIGALIGPSSLIAEMRAIVPPFSLNSFAAEALVTALADRSYTDAYIAQSVASREMIDDYCRTRGIRAFSSHANFVLVRIGPDARLVATGMAARGVFIRDRSDEPGCEGCVRITAGFVEDTRRALAALEEALCDARS